MPWFDLLLSLPARSDLLLAACMHAGFAVLRYSHSEGRFDEDVTQRFQGEHTSLAYGADWQHAGAQEDDRKYACDWHVRHRWIYPKFAMRMWQSKKLGARPWSPLHLSTTTSYKRGG